MCWIGPDLPLPLDPEKKNEDMEDPVADAGGAADDIAAGPAVDAFSKLNKRLNLKNLLVREQGRPGQSSDSPMSNRKQQMLHLAQN